MTTTRQPRRPRGTGATTANGLGWTHQRRRTHLLRTHIDGTPCAHCGQPMWLIQPLDADHTTPRSAGGDRADRLLHAHCNRSRGNGTTTRAAETTRTW